MQAPRRTRLGAYQERKRDLGGNDMCVCGVCVCVVVSLCWPSVVVGGGVQVSPRGGGLRVRPAAFLRVRQVAQCCAGCKLWRAGRALLEGTPDCTVQLTRLVWVVSGGTPGRLGHARLHGAQLTRLLRARQAGWCSSRSSSRGYARLFSRARQIKGTPGSSRGHARQPSRGHARQPS